MSKWTEKAIPTVLKYPILGQIANLILVKKFANLWYKYALPKDTDKSKYRKKAMHSLENGGCFCLSSLVQGLTKETNSELRVIEVPSTLIWGSKDFTHQNTNAASILAHLPNCEIIEFDSCGHFPELENSERYVELISDRMNR